MKLLSQLANLTSAARDSKTKSSPYDSLVKAVNDGSLDISSKDPAMLNLPYALNKAANSGLALRGIVYLTKMIDQQYAQSIGVPYYTMSLIAGETGGTFNPRAYFSGTAIVGERKIPTAAYGLLQQVRSNWDAGIEMAQLTDVSNYAMSTKMLPNIAKMSGTKLANLINPTIFYGPSYSEVYQIVPAAGQIISLVGKIYDQWIFNPGLGWQCKLKPNEMNNPALLDQFYSVAGQNLLSKEKGYMALMTLYHINGGGILTRGSAFPSYFKDRVKKDLQTYQVLRYSPEAYSLVTDTHSQAFEDTKTMGALVDTVITDTHKGHLARPGKASESGGTDIRASYIPVYSPRAGKVKTTRTTGANDNGGYNTTIDLNSGEELFVCHLSKVLVKPGQVVAQGQQIAVSGSTGTKNAHLHVRVRKAGKSIDAEKASFGLQWLINSDYGLSDDEIRIKNVTYK